MNDYYHEQDLLFRWILHHDTSLTISKIRTACENLIDNDNYSIKKYTNRLYYLFFPLLRYGLIEFQGNENYAVSSPVIFSNKSHANFTCINLTDKQLEQIIEISENSMIGNFRICRALSNTTVIEKFGEDENIPVIVPEPLIALQNIPDVISVINKLETCDINKPDYHFKIGKGWVFVKEISTEGIYRHKDNKFCNRYFLINGKFKKLLGREINPELFYISQCAQSSLHKENYLIYNNKTLELKINKMLNIPIIVDRILRLASIEQEDSVKSTCSYFIYPNITLRMYNELKRIFNNNISECNK